MLSCLNQALRLLKNDSQLLQPEHRGVEQMKEALDLGGPPTDTWLRGKLQYHKMPEEKQKLLINSSGRHKVWEHLQQTRFDRDVRQDERLVGWIDDRSLLSLISAMIRGNPMDRVPCRTLLSKHSAFRGEPRPYWLDDFYDHQDGFQMSLEELYLKFSTLP